MELTLLMPRMSFAGNKPIGSSILFTVKKMELPAARIKCSVCSQYKSSTCLTMGSSKIVRVWCFYSYKKVTVRQGAQDAQELQPSILL